MKTRSTLSKLSLALSAALLSACGGGSDNNTTPTTNPIQSGNTNQTGNTNTGTTNTPTTANTAPAFRADFPLWNVEIDKDIKEELRASQINNLQIRIDNQLVGQTLDLNTLAQGLSTKKAHYRANPVINGQSHTLAATDTLRIYKQPNSVVLGSYLDGASVSGSVTNRTYASDYDGDFYIKGNPTTALPSTGVYSYTGKSFSDSKEGAFNYRIDFGTRTGQGSITLDNRNVTLHPANIRQVSFDYEDEHTYRGFGIEGNATATNSLTNATHTGEYELGIFGNNAQEVAGYVDFNSSSINNADIGFGGTRQ